MVFSSKKLSVLLRPNFNGNVLIHPQRKLFAPSVQLLGSSNVDQDVQRQVVPDEPRNLLPFHAIYVKIRICILNFVL